jgi:hypothetical protein
MVAIDSIIEKECLDGPSSTQREVRPYTKPSISSKSREKASAKWLQINLAHIDSETI